MKKYTCFAIVSLFVCLLYSCDQTPLSSGSKADTLKIEFYTVTRVSSSSAQLVWSCSSVSVGYVFFGSGNGMENTVFSLGRSKYHSVTLNSLSSSTRYSFTLFCKSEARTVSSFFTNFTTAPSNQAIRNRGIWILGGVGNANTTVAQVDLYDPDTDTWYPSITTMPTTRVYAGIVSLGGKIYAIGGINSSLNTLTNSVEEYNPETNLWRTMANMPLPIAGAVVSAVGNSIYVIAGSISGGPTIPISTPPLNTVYQFTPDTNTWTTLASSSTILPRADMAGCAINGTIFLTTGRTFAGVSQNTSGAYIPSTNTVASGTVSSFNQQKHGAGSACYRPVSSDPFPNDIPLLVLVGGTTINNTFYPPDSMLVSNAFEIYTGGNTNLVTQGVSLPISVYYPAVEFS
jgi:hypothetical protein